MAMILATDNEHKHSCNDLELVCTLITDQQVMHLQSFHNSEFQDSKFYQLFRCQLWISTKLSNLVLYGQLNSFFYK